jgi:hypothetical protein
MPTADEIETGSIELLSWIEEFLGWAAEDYDEYSADIPAFGKAAVLYVQQTFDTEAAYAYMTLLGEIVRRCATADIPDWRLLAVRFNEMSAPASAREQVEQDMDLGGRLLQQMRRHLRPAQTLEMFGFGLLVAATRKLPPPADSKEEPRDEKKD